MLFAPTLLLMFVLAVAASVATAPVSAASAQAVCPPNPSPPNAADPSLIVDAPADGDSVTSPVRISGQARFFEANVRIAIFDAAGNVLADTFTTAAEGAPTLAPFSADVPFTVTSEQPGCIRVFEESAKDGSAVNVVQIETTLAPKLSPPQTGSGGLLADESGSASWLLPAGTAATLVLLLGIGALTLARRR